MMPRPSIILLILLFPTTAAFADGIPVEPGLWEMKSSMIMPMFPEPRVTVVTECLEKSELSMDELSTEGMDPACSFEKAQVEGNMMTWAFDCPVEGGTSHGEWEAVSNGDSVEGKGKMTMSFQGQTMEMTVEWEGHRVGDCP